jgi:hypothetical protein
MSFSEQTDYADQIVIVDGIGITHFIPRRIPPQKDAPAASKKDAPAASKKEKKRKD